MPKDVSTDTVQQDFRTALLAYNWAAMTPAQRLAATDDVKDIRATALAADAVCANRLWEKYVSSRCAPAQIPVAVDPKKDK